jgi:hypothetical protein
LVVYSLVGTIRAAVVGVVVVEVGTEALEVAGVVDVTEGQFSVAELVIYSFLIFQLLHS